MGFAARLIGTLMTILPLSCGLSAAAQPAGHPAVGMQGDAAAGPARIRVVCGPLPYVSDGQGCDSGIGAELARRACLEAGLACDFEQFPWPRAQKEIETAQADIIIGPYFSPERAHWMVFSRDHFYVDQMRLFHPAGSAMPAPDPAAPRHIGMPLGWVVGGGLEQNPGLVLDPVRTVDVGLNLLAAGRLDAVAAHARAVARFQQDRPGSRFMPFGPALSEQRSYMGYSWAFAATPAHAAFEVAYASLLVSPFYGELLARYQPMEGMVTEVAARAHQFPVGQ